MDRLQGKTVIVTGGGQGIGRAISETFAREGATVRIPDFYPERAAAAADAIKSAGGTAYADQVDVTKEPSVKAMIERAVTKLGRIDVLVNNAGVDILKAIEDMTVEEFDFLMSVNVRGVFLCCKHVIPHMKKAGKGCFVNMGSSAGYIGAPFQTAYCASRGAIHQFTKALAVECYVRQYPSERDRARRRADQHAGYLKDEFAKKGVDIAAFSNMQLEGWATPADIAAMALFLVSDESRQVHGAAL